MRKAAFASHRFKIKFGITEEDEDDVKAAEDDVSQSPQPESPSISISCIPETPIDVSETFIAPVDLEEVTVIPNPPIPTLPVTENVSPPPNGKLVPIRRQTMPEISSDQLLGFTNKSVPIETISRRSSITNVAICSSIGPSLAGIFPGASSNLFFGPTNESDPGAQLLVSSLRRSATFSFLNEPLALDAAARDARGRRWSSKLPFLKNFQHQDSRDSATTETSDGQSTDQQHRSKHHHHHHHHYHHHHHMLPHLHVPTFSITGPATDGSSSSGTGRKFSFGIRRHSHTVRHRFPAGLF